MMDLGEQVPQLFETVDDIKIYDGTTLITRAEYELKINYLKSLYNNGAPVFTDLQPSTLTAQGRMTNVDFIEADVIDMLSTPMGNILMIGCNYGEKFNPAYKIPAIKKTSGRGRKPKPKTQSKRKMQGNGKYFSSQITFLIQHPDTGDLLKIKLFRNGVFQVPGVKNPNMHDLVKPIKILREYIQYNFAENVQIINFTAVMRNYKARLINPSYHVHLENLEKIIAKQKYNKDYDVYVDYMLQPFTDHGCDTIKTMLLNYNPMNIAETTYNTDRCFCLIIKFYRPSYDDSSKKTTVKLLKKGKINFDGGNSQQEIIELYHWLQYIYQQHKSEILFDITKIKNEYDEDTSSCEIKSIYDNQSEDETEDINSDKPIKPTKPLKSPKSSKPSDSYAMIMKVLRQPVKSPKSTK